MDEHSNAILKCYSCGQYRVRRLMRAFAFDKRGQVKTWVCQSCAAPERVYGKPHLAWTTVARAERLAATGSGWSADQVMRRALDLFESTHALGVATEGGK